MRAIILSLIFIMFMACSVSADVTGEIVSIDKDDNGNIRVWTQYKVDGVEVQSQYPKINGKNVYVSGRYHALSFLGMTDAQIKERIDRDIKVHTERLTINTYREKTTDDIFANHLGTVVGSKTTTKDVTKQVDTDGDGVDDKEVTIKSDGSQSISIISP